MTWKLSLPWISTSTVSMFRSSLVHDLHYFDILWAFLCPWSRCRRGSLTCRSVSLHSILIRATDRFHNKRLYSTFIILLEDYRKLIFLLVSSVILSFMFCFRSVSIFGCEEACWERFTLGDLSRCDTVWRLFRVYRGSSAKMGCEAAFRAAYNYVFDRNCDPLANIEEVAFGVFHPQHAFSYIFELVFGGLRLFDVYVHIFRFLPLVEMTLYKRSLFMNCSSYFDSNCFEPMTVRYHQIHNFHLMFVLPWPLTVSFSGLKRIS